MKKTMFCFLALFSTGVIFGQSFEGKITYRNSYKSKNEKIPDQQWATLMGSTEEYFIKGGSYKSLFNGTLVQWQLYNNGENRLYNKLSNSETILWSDAGANSDSVLKVELNKGVAEILGYRCDELILTCRSGVQKFYYSPKIGVDPSLYARHTLMNWSYYLLQAHALPLKTIVSGEQFELEQTAVAISPARLDNTIFRLPEGTKTVKSPY